MFSEYGFNENSLDFEDTDMFLSAISSSIPTMGRLPNGYDLQQNPTGFSFSDASAFGNNSLNIAAGQGAPDVLSDSLSDKSWSPSAPSNERSLFADNSKQRPSFSSTSGSESVASSASIEGTPNTSISSPRTSPEGMSEHETRKPRSEALSSAVKIEAKDDTIPATARKSKVSTKDKISKPGKRPKVSHNMIEKKYRTNINTKIYELRDAVPSLKIAAGKGDISLSDLEGLAPAAKLNKASVLTKATEYIKHLEKKNEAMLQQIAQLQQMMGEANANPPNVMTSQSNGFNNQISQGFGFAPDNNYNVTLNAYDVTAVPQQPYQQPQEATHAFNTNWMMGGLTTLAGSSVLSNDNFKGLASLPFIPSFLTHPSPATLQAVAVLRLGLFCLGAYLLVFPFVNYFRKSRNPKATTQNLWLTWFLVSFGLKVPTPLATTDRERIHSHLLGAPHTSWDWVHDYAILSSSEVTFESCFLNILVGTFITQKYPVFSKLIRQSIGIKSCLLAKLDCPKDSSLERLAQLMKSVDGTSMFESEAHMTRLLNLSEAKNIFTDLRKGDNSLSYIEVFKSSPKDIYGIIFGWRVLDLFYELNLAYLDSMTIASEDEKASATKSCLKEELEKIATVLDSSGVSAIKLYHLSLRSLINPEFTPALMKSMRDSISKTVRNVNSYFEGQDLTDDERWDESETEDVADSSDSTEVNYNNELNDDLTKEGSLLYSLNLVNEEKYVVAASMAILYYNEKKDVEYSRSLLKHLNFKSSKVPLSMLSFTSLLAVVCGLLESNDDDDLDSASISSRDSETLESLIKLLRGWLNDDRKSRSLSHSFRSDLTDLVLTKGMVLHEM